MHLKSLSLVNFKNYEQVDISLSEKMYIRGLIANPVHGDPSLHVITRPKQRNVRLAYPHVVDEETIAVRGASRILKEHLNG